MHVTKKYPNALGGDAVVVSNLEKQQVKAGHKVVILTSNCDEIKNGKTVYKFGLKDTPAALDTITLKRLMSLIMLFFKAFKVIGQELPDIIHTHSVDMAYVISFAARRYKVPIVHTFHIVTFNDPRHKGLRANMELKLLAGAKPARVLILNPADKQDFAQAGFDNVVFVPNGVNVEDWHITGAPKKNELFTFIAVGRLEEQKGFMYLIEAAEKLHKKYHDFQVQIVGEGSKRQELEDLIAKKGLASCVELLGLKSPAELKVLYNKAHVFVLSSLWEGMPLSLLEAWAAGLPAIATSVNSVPYIAKGAAKLVPAANAAQLATVMDQLLNDATIRQKLHEVSVDRVRKNYQWSVISKNIYAEIIK